MPTISTKAVGPFDRRTRRSRCVACARRRIKVGKNLSLRLLLHRELRLMEQCVTLLQCDGGSPCTYCARRNTLCVPPTKETKDVVVFVSSNLSPKENKRPLATAPTQITSLPLSLSLNRPIEYISDFFSTFTTTNSFTGKGTGDYGELASTFQTSTALYNAVLAVAGLHVHGRRRIGACGQLELPKSLALSAYSTSVRSFQAEFRGSDPVSNDASLQTTFLLGLFEV